MVVGVTGEGEATGTTGTIARVGGIGDCGALDVGGGVQEHAAGCAVARNPMSLGAAGLPGDAQKRLLNGSSVSFTAVVCNNNNCTNSDIGVLRSASTAGVHIICRQLLYAVALPMRFS
jgi:hypothetical protein